MDILLVYPSDGIRLFHSMVPLGLLSIGTVMKEDGYSVKILDINHYRGNFSRDLNRWQPRLVGIGGTTPSRMKSFRIARKVRKSLPGAFIVYGGVSATFTAREVLRDIPEIDYVIAGEGEFSFRSLCRHLLDGNPREAAGIAGVASRGPGGPVINPPGRIRDLSQLPVPDRSLLEGDYRLSLDFIRGKAAPVITSRGCPARCNFCSASQMFPGGIIYRPVEQVKGEIQILLKREKIAGIKVFDSTFTASRDYVMQFCEMIAPFKLLWECEIRADTVDRELLAAMKKAGCYYVNIGLETSDPQRLRKIAKGIHPRQVLDVLQLCRETGILTKVFFTFGHPGQTWKECLADVRFIREHRKKIDFYAITVGMRIYPGTRLEKEARQSGCLPADFEWTSPAFSPRNLLVGETADTAILFQPQLGSARLMLLIIILLSRRIYSSPGFMIRIMGENLRTLLLSLSPLRRKNSD
jgi:anaerobic magnesium-protoporphyrin IX monomethyl ester cyclase